MRTKEKLSLLIDKIKISQEESQKAESYADGYLDCLKDIMLEKQGEVGKIFDVRYDGNIRMKVYSEIIPVLNDILNDLNVSEREEKKEEKIVEQHSNESSEYIHPSERARAFLQRIGRI